MKTNNNITGNGTIKCVPGGRYYKAWANYFVKFVQGYRRHGLEMWGLTAQNEPSDGVTVAFLYQCLGVDADLQVDFVTHDLGPALVQNGFGDNKLVILDDERIFLPSWAEIVLRDPSASTYVSGIAVHLYDDKVVPVKALDDTYKLFGQDYFILNTEACVQDNKSNTVLLGNWTRGQIYYLDILQDIEQWVSGWVDWNMVLDMVGGPNWADNHARQSNHCQRTQ